MATNYYIEYITTPKGGVKKLKRDISFAINLADVFDVFHFIWQVFTRRGFFLKAISHPKTRIRLICWSLANIDNPYSSQISRVLAFKKSG